MNYNQEMIKDKLCDMIRCDYLGHIHYLFGALSGVDIGTVRYELGRQLYYAFGLSDIPDFVDSMSFDHCIAIANTFRDHEVLLYKNLITQADNYLLYDMCDDIGIDVDSFAIEQAHHEAAGSLYAELVEFQDYNNIYTYVMHMDCDLFLGNRVPVPDIGRDLRQYLDRV